jgi:hypothetical protein
MFVYPASSSASNASMEYWRPLLQDTNSFASLLGKRLWTCRVQQRGQGTWLKTPLVPSIEPLLWFREHLRHYLGAAALAPLLVSPE